MLLAGVVHHWLRSRKDRYRTDHVSSSTGCRCITMLTYLRCDPCECSTARQEAQHWFLLLDARTAFRILGRHGTRRHPIGYSRLAKWIVYLWWRNADTHLREYVGTTAG